MGCFPSSLFFRFFPDASDFFPRKKLILGRTGWKGSISSLPEEMSKELDRAWDACLETSRPFAACAGIARSDLGAIPLPESWEAVQTVSLFVCTVGSRVSDLVVEAFADERPFSGAVIDACAGEIADGVADRIDEDLEKEALVCGYRGTQRISPGYAPIDLSWNPILLAMIAERFIQDEGLRPFPISSNTETGILLPRKSVLCLKGWIGK